MNREWIFFLLLVGFLSISLGGYGQIVPEKVYGRHSLAELWGRVSDTSRLSVVPLAHVAVMNGKDTVKLVSDLSGRFYYKGRISDTMQIQVTALGFKPFSGYYISKKHGLDVRILLQQDVVELNEVIVTGKKVLMVVKGDTLQYHTEAIKTLVGDKLGDILKTLPGVNMDNGLKVNGVPIQRIYVNGDSLFKGKEALNLIEADNVKGVKVFDERNKEDLAQGMKYGRREKVMDVMTKREVSRNTLAVQARKQKRNRLGIGGGMGTSGNQSLKLPEKFMLDYNYRKGNSFVNGLDFSVKYSNLFLEDKRDFVGSINYAKKFRKISYFSRYQYNNVIGYSNHWEEQDYFPTEQFDARRYEQATSEKKSNYMYSISQGIGFRVKEVNVNLNGQYFHRANKNRRNDMLLSTLNDEVMAQRYLWDFDRNETSQGTIGFIASTRKKKNTFQLSSTFIYDQGEQKGWQLDTLESSNRQIDLNRSWEHQHVTWKSNIDFSRVISRLFKLNVKGDYTYNENGLKGVGENRLTGLLDTVNTRNYTLYSSVGGVEGILSYYGKKVEISGGGAIRYQSRNQVERFPVKEQIKNHFLYFEPHWKMRITLSPTFNFKTDYKVTSKLPSDIELRSEIDVSNPLYLSAGNPNLKIVKEHTLGIQGNKIFVRQSSALGMFIMLTLKQDPIVSNSRYFTETTYLSEYNYTVEQGAILNTYENAEPDYRLDMIVSYEKFWPTIGKCIFSPRYSQSKSPSFVQGERNDLTTTGGGMELRFQSNFSKKLRFSFYSDTEFSRSDSPMGRPNESLREIISCETTTTLVPKHTIAVSLTYNFRKNLTIHQEASEAMLKASISRSFGENFSLELKGENLLNSRQDKRIGRTAQYEYRRGENQMGRYVTLQFSCKF